MKRRTEILLEITQLLVIKKSGRSGLAWCEVCARNVHMITADEAGAIAHQSTRTIYRWVESGRIHFMERPEGPVLICLDSLPSG